MFRRVVAELAPKGLREADLEAVAMMCYSAHIHYEARRQIAERVDEMLALVQLQDYAGRKPHERSDTTKWLEWFD